MWLFTKYGFFSVVRNRHDSSFFIRARNSEHLENLKKAVAKYPLCSFKITTSPDADYPFRAQVSHRDWAFTISATIADAIDYTNFKEKAHELKDDELDEALIDVWLRMRRYQDDIGSRRRHHRLKNGPPKKKRRQKKSTK